MTEEDNFRIRQRAYELWADAGRPAGRHLHFWVLAEREARGGGIKTKEHEVSQPSTDADQDTFPASDPLSETAPGGPKFE